MQMARKLETSRVIYGDFSIDLIATQYWTLSNYTDRNSRHCREVERDGAFQLHIWMHDVARLSRLFQPYLYSRYHIFYCHLSIVTNTPLERLGHCQLSAFIKSERNLNDVEYANEGWKKTW